MTEICNVCDNHIKYNEEVECDVCGKKHHRRCSAIADDSEFEICGNCT